MSHEHFISRNSHFCKSALARFRPHDFVSLLTQYGIGYYERMRSAFKKSSGEVVDMLYKGCKLAGVDVVLNCKGNAIDKQDCFIVSTDKGLLESGSLVIATGGLSYPELGATDAGYRIAEQFGIKVTPMKPGLVPLKFGHNDSRTFSELSGISTAVEVNCNNSRFKGDMLFTHHGLSGPAILQISSYWNKGDEITINLLPTSTP